MTEPASGRVRERSTERLSALLTFVTSDVLGDAGDAVAVQYEVRCAQGLSSARSTRFLLDASECENMELAQGEGTLRRTEIPRNSAGAVVGRLRVRDPSKPSVARVRYTWTECESSEREITTGLVLETTDMWARGRAITSIEFALRNALDSCVAFALDIGGSENLELATGGTELTTKVDAHATAEVGCAQVATDGLPWKLKCSYSWREQASSLPVPGRSDRKELAPGIALLTTRTEEGGCDGFRLQLACSKNAIVDFRLDCAGSENASHKDDPASGPAAAQTMSETERRTVVQPWDRVEVGHIVVQNPTLPWVVRCKLSWSERSPKPPSFSSSSSAATSPPQSPVSASTRLSEAFVEWRSVSPGGFSLGSASPGSASPGSAGRNATRFERSGDAMSASESPVAAARPAAAPSTAVPPVAAPPAAPPLTTSASPSRRAGNVAPQALAEKLLAEPLQRQASSGERSAGSARWSSDAPLASPSGSPPPPDPTMAAPIQFPVPDVPPPSPVSPARGARGAQSAGGVAAGASGPGAAAAEVYEEEDAEFDCKEIAAGVLLTTLQTPGPPARIKYALDVRKASSVDFSADFSGSENLTLLDPSPHNPLLRSVTVEPFSRATVAELHAPPGGARWSLRCRYRFRERNEIMSAAAASPPGSPVPPGSPGVAHAFATAGGSARSLATQASQGSGADARTRSGSAASRPPPALPVVGVSSAGLHPAAPPSAAPPSAGDALAEMLGRLQLDGAYGDAFRRERVDLALLEDLAADEDALRRTLKEVGVDALGHRERIVLELRRLRQQQKQQ